MSTVDPMAAILEPITRLVSTWAALAAIAVVALTAFKVLVLPGLRGRLGERQVAAVLDRIGVQTLHDVILPDGRGGLTQVDHLVLTGAGLLVVETKNYRGSIFGQGHEKRWTQRLGRHSYPFQNPRHQNYLHTEAVQALAPGMPVFGRVVFTDVASFPNGVPEGVSRLCDLRADLQDLLGHPLPPPSPALRAAWGQVQAKADRSPAARRAHLAAIRERRGAAPGRPIAWGLVVLALVGLVALAAPRWWPRPGATVAPTRAHSPTALAAPAATRAASALPALTVPPSTSVSAPLARTRAPATLEWAQPAARSPEIARGDCNAAIAALLHDNTEENRKARDRLCGQGQAGAARPR